MPRLDDLVRDAIDDLVESAPGNSVFTEVAARRTRRRRVRRTAGSVVGVAAVAVAFLAVTLARDDDPAQVMFAGQPIETTTVPPPATQPPPPEPNGGFALWPEDTPAEWQAATEKPAWRFDSVETARRFAADVLGWTEVQPELVMPEAYGRHYRISREPGGPVVIVHMEELQACADGQSCTPAWSVMAVSDEPMPCEDPMVAGCFTMEVLVEDGAAHLTFAMLDAASADVELSSGASVRATTATGEVTLALDHVPDAPGYLLLLFRDAGGRVAHAYGYTLGPADFAPR